MPASSLPRTVQRPYIPFLVLLIAGFLATCADGPRATDVPLVQPATVALNPVIDPALAAEGTADIHRIRITAYLAGTDSILGQAVESVNPSAAEWTLGFSIQPPQGSEGLVLITVELINDSSGETVEWSGIVGPLRILPGTNPEIQDVNVLRGPLDNLSVTAVSIQEPIPPLLEQDTYQLSASATTSNPLHEPQVFWTSLDPETAATTSDGLLTGMVSGSARIVATAGPEADTVSVTVLPRPGGVLITPGSGQIQALGNEVTFSAQVVDGRGTVMPGETVSWSVENPDIIEDLGDGRFRALSRGTTVVVASSVNAPEVTAAAQVRVQQAVAAVEVLPEGGTLTSRNDTLRFTAQAFDANGNPIEGMPFYWSTSNTQIATVDAGGLVTAMNSGTVTVSARVATEIMSSSPFGLAIPGLVGEATLVVARETTGVEVTPSTHTFVSIGEGAVFTARALDANGFTIPGKSFRWTTSDPSVATVTEAGLALSVSNGDAVIAAAVDGFEGDAAVTVDQVAHHLHWVIQPPDGSPGSPLTPSPSVEVVDAQGNRVTEYSGPVSLQAVRDPGPEEEVVAIQGTASVPSVDGLAEFPDVALSTSGTHILRAQASSFAPVASDLFTIGSAELADLTLGMDISGGPFVEGDEASFYLALGNLGPSDATNVKVTNTLPAGVTLLSASMVPPAGWNSVTGEWTISSLLVGATATLRLDVEIDAGTAGTTLTNSAIITSLDQTDPDPENDYAWAEISIIESPLPFSGNALGNTELIVGSYAPPPTPYVLYSIANLLSPTPTLTISSVGTSATTQGGLVTMEADGDFRYTPPAGFNGSDTFTFTTVGGGSATATITVSDMVWYVDNTNASAGTGTSVDPFQTLAQASVATNPPAAPAPIYLHYGDGTAYTGGISLKATQGLYGEGVGMTLPSWPGLQNTASGSYPELTNPSGYGVQLGSGSFVGGINIVTTASAGILANGNGGSADWVYIVDAVTGISLDYATGTFDFTNMVISNATNRGFYVYEGDAVVNYQGDIGLFNPHNQFLYVGSTTGGSVNLTGVFTDQGSSTEAVFLSANSGSVTVTGPLSISDPAGGGVSLSSNSGPVTFTQLSINSTGAPGITAINNTGLTTISSGAINTTSHLGLNINNSPFSGDFSDVRVNNNTGVGGGVYMWNTAPGTTAFDYLQVQTTAPSGGAQFVNAGTVHVTDGSIVGNGVQALSVVNTSVDMTLATLTSLDPSAAAVAIGANFNNVTGTFTAAGGNLFNPQTVDGTSLRVVGGSVDVTYGGQIRNLQPDAWAVQVGARTGGSVTISGFVEDSGRGIQIGGSAGANTGGSVAFTGGMSLIGPGYAGGPPFYAYGAPSNGSLEITGGNNTIAAPVGRPALEINGTTIGPAGVTFRQIQADGDLTVASGVTLNSTGAGSFSITGSGTPGSGGYVDNMAQRGFSLVNTGPVSISYMGVGGNVEAGIFGANLGGLEVIESNIFGAAGLQAIRVDNLNGPAEIRNSTLSNSNGPVLVQFLNTLATSFTLDIVNSTFTVGNPIGSAALLVGTGDTSSGVVNVTGSTFNNSGRGINAYAQGSSTMELNIGAGSLFDTNQYGLYFWQNEAAAFTFDIQNSTFQGNTLYGVLGTSNVSAVAAGDLTGQILNTTVQNSPDGILITYPGGAGGYLRFQDNAIDPLNGQGIQVQAGTAGAAASASVGVEATGNVFNVDLAGPGIFLNNYGGTTMCAAVTSNTIDVSDGDWLSVEQGESTAIFNLEGLNGGTGFITDSPTISAFLESTNTLLSGGIAHAFLNTGMYGVPVGSCVPAGIFP